MGYGILMTSLNITKPAIASIPSTAPSLSGPSRCNLGHCSSHWPLSQAPEAPGSAASRSGTSRDKLRSVK